MERKYKVFISYRHLPLDMRVAKKLHQRIEHFVIPKALRKNGEKKLGLVFRDQDELPISSDLSSDIQTALDNSEYLVVICTPQTQESKWVMREISYFLEHHDRDHVLAVLASGSPEESFPDALTKVYSSEGDVIDEIEPLAANIAADTQLKSDMLFQTESLRILATLIGCPFDHLYQRDQRYRKKRVAAAIGVIVVIALAFIGVLINRNRLIAEQLRVSQINESTSLAQLAQSEYKEGKYREAIEHLISALPSDDNERPYVAAAEKTLGSIIHPYEAGTIQIDQSISQETAVSNLSISKDGRRLVTIDSYRVIRCFDTVTGKQLWEILLDHHPTIKYSYHLDYNDQCNSILVQSKSSVHCLSADTGEVLWKLEETDVLSLNKDRQEVLIADSSFADRTSWISVVSMIDGAVKLSLTPENATNSSTYQSGCISDDGKYIAFIYSPDLYGDMARRVSVLDRSDLSFSMIDTLSSDVIFTTSYVAFAPDDSLILVDDSSSSGIDLCKYVLAEEWHHVWSSKLTEDLLDFRIAYTRGDYSVMVTGIVNALVVRNDYITIGDMNFWAQIDMATGDLKWSRTLHDNMIQAVPMEEERYCLLLENGVMTIASATGYTGEEAGLRYYDSGIIIANGVLTGESFEETTAAIVPNDSPDHIIILRKYSNGSERFLSPNGSWADVSGSNITASMSGEYYANLKYEYDDRERYICMDLWDMSTGTRTSSYRMLELAPSLYNNGNKAMTNSGSLIHDAQVIDKDGNTRSLLEGWDGSEEYRAIAVSVKNRSMEKVITGIIWEREDKTYDYLQWEDGETLIGSVDLPIPEKTEDAGNSRYYLDESKTRIIPGAAGRALVSILKYEYNEKYEREEEIEWFVIDASGGKAEYVPDFECDIPVMAETRPLIAAVFGDDLTLYDLDSMSPVRSFERICPAYQYRKLMFAENDRYLIAFSETGNIVVFDTDSGKYLMKYSAGNFSFASDSRYEFYETLQGDRLLIIYRSKFSNEAVLFVLDLDAMDIAGIYSGVEGYCSQADELLISHYNCDPFLRKLLGTSDLRTLANDYLNR